jgi:hypothetical protein
VLFTICDWSFLHWGPTLVPHVWGIYANATDIIGLEVIGIALVVVVALVSYWIADAARAR